ncbi:protein FAM151A [Esox lucius]|uniref:Protein FAM151A n=1 Tax=Esox lucius TaxID=8010 RepID=A0A3P8ZA99_ESOLU|nr:protein FAM151A [Esox lucius]XP_034147217.1 protein FAM151A [Esox lucius]
MEIEAESAFEEVNNAWRKQTLQERKERDEEDEDPRRYFQYFTKEQLLMLCVTVGLLVLILIITVTSFVLTKNSDTSEMILPFASDGDMLDFLIQTGDISERDALHATWYHRANNKSEMNKALKSSAMVLEADVTVQGFGNMTTIPIMAHPPDVYSDNTLDQWLDAVLQSKKGVKLDFKSFKALPPSLDILRIKNQTNGINRPVWLNADILPGPNVPAFWPVINGPNFLALIQQKFPHVTISPGWAVLYLPLFPNVTYTQAMVKDMYTIVEKVPQKVTFPIHALMVKSGWPHISWLLSQSPRFSLTLWQGKENPSVNDLLFVRDNSNPERVYYDIYEPVLSHFKEAARQKGRQRRFYPGGELVDYFQPKYKDSLSIQWNAITDRVSLLSLLSDSASRMLIIPVGSGSTQPGIPVVAGSSPEFFLWDCLDLILASHKPWGIFLTIQSKCQLEPSLVLLRSAYNRDILYRPVWVNMALSYGAFHTQGYITGRDFLHMVNHLFPYVTLAPSWPLETQREGFTKALLDDMVELLKGVWQSVSLQVRVETLCKSVEGQRRLGNVPPHYSLTLESRIGNCIADEAGAQGIMANLTGSKERIMFCIA